MKTLLYFTLVLGFTYTGQSQESLSKRFIITILDSTVIENVQRNALSVDIQFTDQTLNQLVENYDIIRFERKYPASRFRYLRDVWYIECNSEGLVSDLMNDRPDIFVDGKRYEEISQITYTPDDYGLATGNLQKDLDLIRAKEAWDITKGD